MNLIGVSIKKIIYDYSISIEKHSHKRLFTKLIMLARRQFYYKVITIYGIVRTSFWEVLFRQVFRG